METYIIPDIVIYDAKELLEVLAQTRSAVCSGQGSVGTICSNAKVADFATCINGAVGSKPGCGNVKYCAGNSDK